VKLTELIESRLNQVYTLKLSQLVSNLEPSLRSLLSKLSTEEEVPVAQELDSSKFLFSLETPQYFGSAPARSNSTSVDPFASFMVKVGKRVEGRSPLIDSALEELERSVSQIRTDLRSWMSEETKMEDGQGRTLRERYVEQVGVTLEGILAVLDKVMSEEETNADKGEQFSLFSLSQSDQTDVLLLLFDFRYLKHALHRHIRPTSVDVKLIHARSPPRRSSILPRLASKLAISTLRSSSALPAAVARRCSTEGNLGTSERQRQIPHRQRFHDRPERALDLPPRFAQLAATLAPDPSDTSTLYCTVSGSRAPQSVLD
jgi:hypothetical protein